LSGKTQFGIVSFAHYHANFWSAAINESPDADLVGVWDDDSARGKERAAHHNTQFYDDLTVLLEKCDAVGITSETVKHRDLVKKAAEAGCHILLEKPMAMTVAECREIHAAITRAGVIFQQSFPKRYDPINHELVEHIKSGALGKIAMVRVRHANFHLRELGHSAAAEWFGDPMQSGGGSLLDEGIHAADFLLWLLGEPTQVYATHSNSALGLGLDDTGMAIFNYANGSIAELVSSGTFIAAEESIEVYGTEGSAILTGVDLASRDFSSSPYLRFFHYGDERGTWRESQTTPAFKEGYFHQRGPLHFLKVLRGEAEPVVSLDEGWKSLAMIEAAYRAAETGQAQPLDFSL
jgi:predicted dehydrogenase